ncbi:sugar transferase [Carboxylicivirga sp. RSCT41]|uniref:sugar transferase n=1 Tax=Carboxylicivirga agarovorans TaxID=3417570 RepID=UPI003D33ABF9
MYKFFFKRLFDIIFSIVAFILLSPVFIIVTIFLTIANNGKPFFFQKRPGKNERIFKIIKFKTMNDRRGDDGALLPDSERLTKVGHFVRKTSLDEIPQLLNVIIGDMSLIGPRPLLPEYLPYYTEEEKLRHSVRPGVTGWAQVNGRNNLSWDDKLNLDVYYVHNLSFALDFKIIPKTIFNVLSRKDINVVPSLKDGRFDDYRKNKGAGF